MALSLLPLKGANAFRMHNTSATTQISVWKTWVFPTALTALTEPRTLGHRITCFPLHTHLLYFAPGMWSRICTIRTTRMLHSLQGLHLCSRRLHNAWQCLCLSSADSHMPQFHLCLALRFGNILQYSLRCGYIACRWICFSIIVFYMSKFYCPIFTLSSTMPTVLYILRWSIIGLRCWFLLIRIRIDALRPVDITYSAISPPDSVLIHHPLATLLPPHPHPHPHRRHPRPHTCRHHWFPIQTSRVHLRAVVAGWRCGWHRARRFRHLHLNNSRCPLASRNATRHPCNCCPSGCLGQCFQSQASQAPLRRSNSQ